jgi:lysophospholipase L1-like esterase
MLWHWENGISEARLNPKLWFIMVGGNDLFESKCTNRFVFANILNVLKRIFEAHPNSEFIVHGIMPRTDDPGSTSLGHLWKRAQDINFLIRKFSDRASHIHYVNAGTKFTVESGMKGRRHLDPELMTEGMYPTAKGMRVWGDYIEKKVTEILHGRKVWDKQMKKEADAAAAAAAAATAAEDNNEN